MDFFRVNCRRSISDQQWILAWASQFNFSSKIWWKKTRRIGLRKKRDLLANIYLNITHRCSRWMNSRWRSCSNFRFTIPMNSFIEDLTNKEISMCRFCFWRKDGFTWTLDFFGWWLIFCQIVSFNLDFPVQASFSSKICNVYWLKGAFHQYNGSYRHFRMSRIMRDIITLYCHFRLLLIICLNIKNLFFRSNKKMNDFQIDRSTFRSPPSWW